MKYKITRLINLGKYGIPYESIGLTVEEAESWEEAEKEIKREHQRICELFIPKLKERLEELNKKQNLSYRDEREREELKKALNEPPF